MKRLLATLLLSGVLLAQVRHDYILIGSGGTIDASSAGVSKPVASGTALPATCSIPQMFFLTTATAGQNIHLCTATNTWTQMAGGTGGENPLTFNTPLSRAVNTISLSLATGGLMSTTGGLGLTQCPNGNSIVNTGGTSWGCWATPGTVTNVSGTANEITVANGGTTPALSLAATFDISGKTSTKPVKTGTVLPATCGIGELFYKTDATAGQNIYSCTALNTWTQHTGGSVSAATVGPALYIADTGAVNALAGCPTPSVGALANGQLVYVAAAATNTGASTFNLCALLAKPIVNADGTVLQPGAIQQATAGNPGYAGMMYSAGCSCFQLLSPNVPLLPAQSSATKNLYARSNGSSVTWASPFNPGSGRRNAMFMANGYNADANANGAAWGAMWYFNTISAGGSLAGSAGVAGTEYPYVRLTTGIVSGNDQFLYNYPNTKNFKSGRNLLFDDVIKLSTATTLVRVWNGFTSSDAGSVVGSDTQPAGAITFRYSTNAADTAWQCVMANAGVATTVSSGVAPTANQMRFQIVADDTANTVRWYIDGVEVCTSFAMTNYPAAIAMQPLVSVTTLSAAARSLDVSYAYVEADK